MGRSKCKIHEGVQQVPCPFCAEAEPQNVKKSRKPTDIKTEPCGQTKAHARHYWTGTERGYVVRKFCKGA